MFTPYVFAKIDVQLNIKEDNILNNIQKRARKRFIYSNAHSIITDRKTIMKPKHYLDDHHEKNLL